ncbi:uncharacterized protein LOC126260304 [Schistocerca nitens]|uniref:uncharacterized protein LOC126260304 n=1 Tax=Schistocerca nitens TaxID=7011 RepID=UPI002119010F|nr:uncharacterized protein LOC126260304 [Schistocerca nitens]
MPPELELKIVNYVTTMQSLGFGLTVNQMRSIVYRVAEAAAIKRPFSKDMQMAGWWDGLKQQYNLSLRTPENLSLDCAAMANRPHLNDFYDRIKQLINKLNLGDKPARPWNCDELGLSYVLKSGKVVSQVGKKYIYKQSFGERGTTTTVLCCVSASGMSVPPMVIFKGVRMSDKFCVSSMPSLIHLSLKGWINADLFLEWFQHFLECIPPHRPIILFMDSHESHMIPETLSLASDNDVHIVTFSAHITHLLQPLAVGVYKPLKDSWRKQLATFMTDHPGQKPLRDAVSDHALAPSSVTQGQKQELSANKTVTVEDILKLPVCQKERKEMKRDPSVKKNSFATTSHRHQDQAYRRKQ